MCVVVGVIVKKYFVVKFGIVICGCLMQMGDILLVIKDWDQVEQNFFFCLDLDKIDVLDELMCGLKKEGDFIGVKVMVVVDGVLSGFGELVFDCLDVDIVYVLMSINVVKGVEIGDGFEVVKLCGSENCDEIIKVGFQSNYVGGIFGGISSGQQIVVNIVLKFIFSIIVFGYMINCFGEEVEMIIKGCYDLCVGICVVLIVEVMLVIVLMDYFMCQCVQNGDVMMIILCW